MTTDNTMKISFKKFLLEITGRTKYAADRYSTELTSALGQDSSAGHITVPELVQLIHDKIDPTKTKHHVVWLARMYSIGQFRVEDATRLKGDLELFEKVKSKLKNRDLNSYKTLDALYDVLKPFESAAEDELMSNKQKVAAVKSDVEVFLDRPDFKVVIPKTHEASCFYGSGTKWCATGKDSSSTFESYTARGPLFILLTKLDGKQRKFQLHYEDSQFMNERDQPVSKGELEELSKLDGYHEFLNLLIKKHYHPHVLDVHSK